MTAGPPTCRTSSTAMTVRMLFYRYNPVTNRWTNLPSPEYSYRYGGVIGKKFYAVGAHVEVYDPATNRWTTKRDPTRAPSFGGGANRDAESNLRRGWRRKRQRRQLGRSPRACGCTTQRWAIGRAEPTCRPDATAWRQPRSSSTGSLGWRWSGDNDPATTYSTSRKSDVGEWTGGVLGLDPGTPACSRSGCHR